MPTVRFFNAERTFLRLAAAILWLQFNLVAGSAHNGSDPGVIDVIELEYKPCMSNDECEETEYCRSTSVVSWEGIPWKRGECVACALCTCHYQSVDGACPIRCGIPEQEVSELQGVFYSNGTRPTDEPGCSVINVWTFRGRSFRLATVQANWAPNARFSSDTRTTSCGNRQVRWGIFSVDSSVNPSRITMNYFEDTALGFSSVTGIMRSACPNALTVKWSGASEDDLWTRVSEDISALSPTGSWEGELLIYGSVCKVNLQMKLILAASDLYHWNAHVHSCSVGLDSIPDPQAEQEEEEEPEQPEQRRMDDERQRLLGSAEALKLPSRTSLQEAEAVKANDVKPVLENFEKRGDVGSAGDDALPRRRSDGTRNRVIFTSVQIPDTEYVPTNLTTMQMCSDSGRKCRFGSTCWLSALKPEARDFALQNPVTSAVNLSLYQFIDRCKCPAGYQGDGITECNDYDECSQSDVCFDNSVCRNSVGSFECICVPGYNISETRDSCENVDECELDTDNCDKFADCTDTIGSFTCECILGHAGTGTSCESESTLSFEDFRMMGGGSQIVSFRLAWENKAVTDVKDVLSLSKDWDRQISWLYLSAAECPSQSRCLYEECILDCHRPGLSENPHYAHEFFVNSAGPGLYTAKVYSHKLDSVIAVAKIILNGTTGVRVFPPDAGEMVQGGLDDCTSYGLRASCKVTIHFGGGLIERSLDGTPPPIEFYYRCGDGRLSPENETCDDGNTENGDGCSRRCQVEPDSACITLTNPDLIYDADLQLFRVRGPPDSTCTVYVCGDGERNLRTRVETCDDENTRGGDGCSSECTVEPGYDCERVERVDASGIASGSYERCVPFILWGVDKDGCPPCHPLGDCVLWVGEKHCYCYDGYAKNFSADAIDRPLMTVEDVENEPHFCRDVDECAAGIAKDICSINAICTNTVGSFTCSCPPGYLGSGYGTAGICIDIDECGSCVSGASVGTCPCAPNAICEDTAGSFMCYCEGGMTGGGRAQDGLCKDQDECLLGTHSCGTSQTCANKIPMFECLCPQDLFLFGRECFPPGFARDNMDLFRRLGQDGIPTVAQGAMRLWDLPYMNTWGRFSFAELNYVDQVLSPTVHKTLSFIPSTGLEAFPIHCPSCHPDGIFIYDYEGIISMEQGVFLSDVECRWMFTGVAGAQIYFHFLVFKLEPDLEHIEVCKIGNVCERYDSTTDTRVAKYHELPFEMKFHSVGVNRATDSSQNPPDPDVRDKFVLLYSPTETKKDIDVDQYILPVQDLSNGTTAIEKESEFERNSKMEWSIINGDGLFRELPCGYTHTPTEEYSKISLSKRNSSSFKKSIRHETDLEGLWEGTCFPNTPPSSLTCQVDLQVEGNIFELTYFQCTGFDIMSYATGVLAQVDTVAKDIRSLSGVHLLSYKRFSVIYTEGIPQDAPDKLLSGANGIFLWRSDEEYAPERIEINLHRPGQRSDTTSFPGDNADLETQLFSCQILYLTKAKSKFILPLPRPSLSTVFFAAVKEQNIYLTCNSSITALMNYLDESNCRSSLRNMLGTTKNLLSFDFRAECESGCLGTYRSTLESTVDTCRGAWMSLQSSRAEGVTEQIHHYLAARVLFLAASRARTDTVCVGSYRNLSCNFLPPQVATVTSGSCALARAPNNLPPEIGPFPYIRFDLSANLRSGCNQNCRTSMDDLLLLGHCCIGILNDAQQNFWKTIGPPTGSQVQFDLAAYRCIYSNGPCDQSVSDVVTLKVPADICGYTQQESWDCAYGSCGRALPAKCCQPFACRNDAWRESYGACYCRCVNAYTGRDCGARAVHVVGELQFRESNMVAFDNTRFLRDLANGMGVQEINVEMASITVQENTGSSNGRRIGRMQDTIIVAFRIIVENEQSGLRTAQSMKVMQDQGTFAVIFSGSGFGNFGGFTKDPQPLGRNGEGLCDDEVFLCDRSEFAGNDTDGETFTPTEKDDNTTTIVIISTVLTSLCLISMCCVWFVISGRESLGRYLEEQKGHESDHHAHKKKPRKLTKREIKQRQIDERRKLEEAQGYQFGFGVSHREVEQEAEVTRAVSSQHVSFVHGVIHNPFANNHVLSPTGSAAKSYNRSALAGRSLLEKESLLADQAKYGHHHKEEVEHEEPQVPEDPAMSLKRIAAHQRMLAARLAAMDANGPGALSKDTSRELSLNASFQPMDSSLSYPHDDFDDALQTRDKPDPSLSLFDRGTPLRPLKPRSLQISSQPGTVNINGISPPTNYLHASLVHSADDAGLDADSLLSSALAPPPIPAKFDVPRTPDKMGGRLGPNGTPAGARLGRDGLPTNGNGN